jgi:hypothetical protein
VAKNVKAEEDNGGLGMLTLARRRLLWAPGTTQPPEAFPTRAPAAGKSSSQAGPERSEHAARLPYSALAADNSQDLANGNGHRPALEVVPPPAGAPIPPSGYAQVPNAVLLEHHPGLRPPARILYALLVAHEGQEGCFPGMERLSTLMGCRRCTVFSSLTVLERLAWLAVDRNKRQANRYHILLPTNKDFTRVARKLLYDPTPGTRPPSGSGASTSSGTSTTAPSAAAQ